MRDLIQSAPSAPANCEKVDSRYATSGTASRLPCMLSRLRSPTAFQRRCPLDSPRMSTTVYTISCNRASSLPSQE